ncbi:hypothetical protein [Chromobacterium violaceum]|uniref:hypothetical protein n=1 Tax=Chromobacterium violaceum TaxID=536 RepID=UPI00143DC010|nr:hypothetical protein [Chromobacterium violaceum]QIY81465.1 hypothetical protein FOB43_20840 [Chromobacterium violaceum]
MKVNAEKLEQIIQELSSEVGGWSCSSSVFVGEVNGNPVRIEVMTPSEAADEHDFDGVGDEYRCIGEQASC